MNSNSLSSLYCAAALPLSTFWFKSPSTGKDYEISRGKHLFSAEQFKIDHALPKKTNHYIEILANILAIYGPDAYLEIEVRNWYFSYLKDFLSLPGQPSDVTKLKSILNLTVESIKQGLSSHQYAGACPYAGAWFELTKELRKAKIVEQQCLWFRKGTALESVPKTVCQQLEEAVAVTSFFKLTQKYLKPYKVDFKKPVVFSYLGDQSENHYFWQIPSLAVGLKAHSVEKDTLVLSYQNLDIGAEEELKNFTAELNSWFEKNGERGPDGNILKVIFV